MSEKTKLKPCPFCGGIPNRVTTKDSEENYIECMHCLASNRVVYGNGEDPWRVLDEAWNNRVN